APTEMIHVCFDCLGITCREPTADGVFRTRISWAHLVEPDRVVSCEASAAHIGPNPDPTAQAAAAMRRYELLSRARQFKLSDFQDFDYILAMDRDNLEALQELRRGMPVHEGKRAHLSLLRDFDPDAGVGAEVPDPYYGGKQGFEEVLDLCERACQGLLDTLRPTLSGR